MRKLGIEAVRDDKGQPLFDKAEADDYLSQHWGRRFAENPIEEQEAIAFTRHFSRRFPPTQWLADFAPFACVVADCKISAPGPDGIPYAAWASSIIAQ
eukprot:7821880-Karenia_brevis.AAC.1